MKIKLLISTSEALAGAVIDVNDGKAKELIDKKFAEKIDDGNDKVVDEVVKKIGKTKK